MTKKLNYASLAAVCGLIAASIVLYIIMGLYALVTRILFSAALLSVILYLSINYRAIALFFRRTGTVTGVARIFQLLIVFGILVFVYIFSGAVSWKIDLTASRIYTLSDETAAVLRSLTNDINIYFFKFGDKSDPVLDYEGNLLKVYSERCGRLKLKIIDPNSDRSKAAEYNVSENGTVVFEYQGNRAYAGVKKIFSSDPETGRISYKGEAVFTSALKSVVSGRPPDVYFLQGHGEVNAESGDGRGYSGIIEKMTEENIRVKVLNLLKFPEIPGDCGAIIIGNPTHSFSADELDKIDNFINGGGSVLVLLELETHETVNDILKQMGLYYYKNLAVEDQDYAVQYGKTTILPEIVPHEITMPLIRNSLSVVMPTASGILETPRIYRASNDQYIISGFLKTSKNSYGEVSLARIKSGESYNDPKTDLEGPLTLGCSARKIHADIIKTYKGALTNTIESRMIVFGDSDFIKNTYYNNSGNSDLFLNSVNYLLRRDAEITIRPKNTEITGFQLSSSEQRFLAVLSAAVFFLYIIPGIIIVIGRRSRIKS